MTIGLRDVRVPEPLELYKVDSDDNVFFSYAGKFIGCVYDSPTHDCRMYVTARDKYGAERQFMNKYNSFAIDSHVIEELDNEWDGVEMVAVFVMDEGDIYLFDLETYVTADEHNYEYGDQRFPHVNTAESTYENVFTHETKYPKEICIG